MVVTTGNSEMNTIHTILIAILDLLVVSHDLGKAVDKSNLFEMSCPEHG